MTTEQAVVKLKLSKPLPTGTENYQQLQQIWKQEKMSSLKDVLRWYNKIDFVLTLEVMQKLIAFYHDKCINIMKLGCTLPYLANNCLHKPTVARFYSFTKGKKDPLEKIHEDGVGGPSTVCTRKTVVDETLIGRSTIIYKKLLGLMLAKKIHI